MLWYISHSPLLFRKQNYTKKWYCLKDQFCSTIFFKNIFQFHYYSVLFTKVNICNSRKEKRSIYIPVIFKIYVILKRTALKRKSYNTASNCIIFKIWNTLVPPKANRFYFLFVLDMGRSDILFNLAYWKRRITINKVCIV